MLTAAPETRGLLTTSAERLAAYYRRAVADQFEGKPADRSWRLFRLGFARVWLVAKLEGKANAYRKAELRGASFAYSTAPIRPETFDRNLDPTLIFDFGDDAGDAFIVGPFLEAIQAFDTRVPMLRDEVRALAAEAKMMADAVVEFERVHGYESIIAESKAMQEAVRNAFWVSDVDKSTVTNVRSLIADIIRGDAKPANIGLPEFIDEAQAQGAANLTRHRLEVVFRNNVQTAYNDGQADALESEDVQTVLPLVMLLEIRDRRSRGNPSGKYPKQGKHYQMHGYVNTIEEFKRLGIVPPNGHQCRGTTRGVTWAEAKKLGLVGERGNIDPDALRAYNGERQDIIERGEYPDPGWTTRAA